MKCEWHLCDNLVTGRRRKFCSDACKGKWHVTQTRRRNKERLVAHFGGACVRCGYDRCFAALQFHHTEDNKEFGIAYGGSTMGYDRMLAEAEKCELICANCHAEEHSYIAL